MFGIQSGKGRGSSTLPFGITSSLNSAVVIPAAAHFWPMNEGTGNTLVDNIGTTNLTTTNVTWNVTSGLGAAAVATFGGTSKGLASAVDPTLNFSGILPFTVSVWVNVAVNTSLTLAGNLTAPTTYAGWEIGLSGNAGIADPVLLLVNTVTSNQMSARAPVATPTGAAQLLVFTYTGSLTLAGVKIYVNGVNQTPLSDVSGTLSASFTSATPFLVGQRTDGTSGYQGAMAFMRTWNQVLTAAQIAKLFSQGPQ